MGFQTVWPWGLANPYGLTVKNTTQTVWRKNPTPFH
jgi:hypothetical protein